MQPVLNSLYMQKYSVFHNFSLMIFNLITKCFVWERIKERDVD